MAHCTHLRVVPSMINLDLVVTQVVDADAGSTHNDAANIRWARKSARANCSISSVERAWTHRV